MVAYENRKQLLKKGTKLGLVGDYNSNPIWGDNHILSMTLFEYIIIERHDGILVSERRSTNYDIGIIAVREKPIKLINVHGTEYYGKRFLLLQRYIELSWDNLDVTVYSFGLSNTLNLAAPLDL